MEGFGNSCIATSDHSYRSLSEEGGVTGSAKGYAPAAKFFLSKYIEFLPLGAVGDYYCPGC